MYPDYDINGQYYELDQQRYEEDYGEPSARYIPPNVIQNYIGEVINTYIPGYGRRNVYVKGMSRNGMVQLVLLKNSPRDCISVHYSDLSGIGNPQFKCY